MNKVIFSSLVIDLDSLGLNVEDKMGRGSVKIHTGRGKVKTLQPVPAAGGVQKTKIGKHGIQKMTKSSGGGGHPHLPGSYDNADVKGRIPSPKTHRSGEGGPHWNHMPKTPEAT